MTLASPDLSSSTTTNDLRPEERVWRTGPFSSGDAELLSLVLGANERRRRPLDIAHDLVAAAGIGGLARSTPRELAALGVSRAGATRIAAAFELGRRSVSLSYRRAQIARPDDVYHAVIAQVAGLSQEVFLVLGVDIRNGLLDIVECARGSVLGVEIHPREVFRPLVRMAAAGGVIVHNHPSGDPTPSAEDVELTRRLRDIGSLVGIPILDHVVVGNRSFRSIAEWMAM